MRPIAPMAAPMAAPIPAPTTDEVERFLGELVAGLTPAPTAPGRHRGRPPILPATLLWAGLAVCVLRRATSHLALWRLLSGHGLWDFPAVPVTDDAVAKRLSRDGAAPMARLVADLTAVLTERVTPHADRTLAPFATEVVAIDETTLDPVARRLPTLRGIPKGDDRLLPGKLAGVYDLRRQLWRHLDYLPHARQNERVAAREMAATLPPGCLLLGDLGYFGFAWFDDLTDAGQWGVSRLRAKTSYAVVHTHYEDGDTLDALVRLGTYRADRAKHLVRLVQFRHGPTLYRYLTNVRDPHRLPLSEVARLYARRWDIEMAVNLAKTHLGLHLLWSAKPGVILAQVWAVLLVTQVLQTLRWLVAAEAGVALFDVSLPLLIRYLPQYARRGLDPIPAFVADGRRLGFIRPARCTVIHAPPIPPEDVVPPPPDLPLTRLPRYARRNCGPRPPRTAPVTAPT